MWFLIPVSVISAPLSCWASLITRRDPVGWDPMKYPWNFVSGSVHVVTEQCEPDQHGGGKQTQTLAFFWWNRGETFPQPVDPLSWLRCLSKAEATLLFHCVEVKSAALQHLWFVTPCVISWASWVLHPCSSPPKAWYRALLSAFIISKFTGLWGSSEKLLVASQSQLVFMI